MTNNNILSITIAILSFTLIALVFYYIVIPSIQSDKVEFTYEEISYEENIYYSKYPNTIIYNKCNQAAFNQSANIHFSFYKKSNWDCAIEEVNLISDGVVKVNCRCYPISNLK